MRRANLFWGFYGTNPFKQTRRKKQQRKNIFLTDTDRDGVANIFDCRPFIKRLQHVKPNILIEEELKKLPIFFIAETGHFGKKYHYSEKKMSKGAKRAKQRFQSIVRKRPDIVGEIKRKKAAVLITTRGIESRKGGKTELTHGYAIQTEKYKLPKGGETQHAIVARLASQRGYPYRGEDIREGAGTIVHELEHVRQYHVHEKKPKLEKQMWKGRYYKKPAEKQAVEAEKKAEQKRTRITYGTHKYFWPMFRKMTGDEEEEYARNK